MPAWWHAEAAHGWRMSYSGDNPRKAEETADRERRKGKETKTMRHTVNSLAGKPYVEYVTLTREKGTK